jgi:hypothetical protein
MQPLASLDGAHSPYGSLASRASILVTFGDVDEIALAETTVELRTAGPGSVPLSFMCSMMHSGSPMAHD